MKHLSRYARLRRTLLGAERISLGEGLHGAIDAVGGIFRITVKGKSNTT